ncbi:MAG TPA: hypothetical protein DCS73_05525 [Roseburia sp.]|nr:hypothetical protein [Roseburia sp.]
MKKRNQAGKRIAAWLMALSLCVTAVPAGQVVFAADAPNETEMAEISEATENSQVTENFETEESTGETEAAETTENTGTEETSETAGDTGKEKTSEATESAEGVTDTETTESTEGATDTETTENTEGTEGSEETESTQKVENLKAAAGDPETEESEDIIKKDGNVTPGSTYETAASIELNTVYTATTEKIASISSITEIKDIKIAHWYKFTMNKSGMVQLKFSHDKINTTNDSPTWKIDFIADSTGSMTSINSNAYDTENHTAQIGLEKGEYYVKITGISNVFLTDSYSYRFSVQYKDAYCETERNNDISTADVYDQLGQTITGSIHSVSDVDYYRIETAKDGYIVVNLTHDKVAGRQNAAVYAVTVCDASGNSVYEMTSKAEEESTDSIKLGLTAGKYFIKVAGVKTLAQEIYDGNYGLKAAFTECSTWERESNDTYDTANTAVSGTTYSGDIRTFSDVDYFKTTLSANGYINVKLTHPVVSGQETTNMYVLSVIRKVDKDQYTEVYTTNIRGGDTSVSTPNLGLPQGEYYVKIAGTGKSLGTAVSIASYPVNYDVCIVAETADNRETESNDTAATANTVKSGKTYYGSTSSSSDKDYYKIVMSKAGYLQIKFGHKNSQSTASCYNVVIYNKDESEIYSFTNKGTETSYTSCKLGLGAGEYYACVSQASTLYTGDYTICMTQKAASGWETENNGDWASADNIKVGKAVKGVITGFTSDEDYYRFTLTKAQYVNFSLAHKKINDAGRSWYVTLYNANGRRVSRRDDDHIYSYAGSTYTESAAVKLSRGTYYLKVQAYAKNAVDKEYTLCVNKIQKKKTSVTSVKSTAHNKLKVSWKVVPAAASYQIYRSTQKDGDYQNIKTIDSVGTSSWTDSSVKTGQTYYYKIKAVVKTQDGNKTSGFSNVKSAKAVPAKTTLKAKASDAKNVKLTWSKVKGANGYEIYRSTGKNGKYKKVTAISKAGTTSYKNGKLKKSTTYYYKIRAYRKVDGKKVYGDYSSVVSVKTKAE